ncbi:MAG TPA: low molecular weight protein arginine phosphatase [Candidatus Methylomirabilis sp.]|nr:low molecular weight protein arginine phosphatase [Candidatus Methylomirabilis sp.]
MKRILFVCTGNICRSPMAEVLLRDALQQDPELRSEGIEVRSAGTSGWDGAPATDLAVQAMLSLGLNLRGHRGRQLTRELVDWAECLLTMEARQRDWIQRAYPDAAAKVFSLADCAGDSGDVEDPYGGDEAEYTQCARRLCVLIPGLITRLRARRNPGSSPSSPG